ncbi:hypothetical protein JCM10213_002493 [Rhodosporidiobolus nylandii]
MGNSQSSSGSGSSKPASSGLRSRSNTLDTAVKAAPDSGYLEPQSLLYSHVEYNRQVVHKLIGDRRLSPFYLGLLDFEDEWGVDELVKALGEAEQQATQNLKDALAAANESANDADAQQLNVPPGTRKHKEAVAAYNAAVFRRERLAEMLKAREKRGGGGLQVSSKTEQARLYQGRALECPICFLYYPPNMVHTRCCDQPICTECFVQIKRADPTPTHLESEPACCPFCMEPNFGCVYTKPALVRPPVQQSSSGSSMEPSSSVAGSDTKPRRKSFAHTEKEVVTTDMVHPDWEAKLEAMKAAVARRANRRIVFRQVGDRLIPVGITSGRGEDGANPTMATTTLPPNFLSQIAAALDASNEGGSTSSGRRRGSRSSRRRGNGDGNEVIRLLESLGLGGGVDLEEMMLQEAMRQSQLEEEERQKKVKAEEEAKAKAAGAVAPTASPPAGESSPQPVPTDVSHTPRTTERMLHEAVEGSALSTSPASPPPNGSSHRTSDSLSSLSALAAGGLAASAISPSTSSSFPQPGEPATGTSLGRGIVGAGLAAASTSHAGGSPSPPIASTSSAIASLSTSSQSSTAAVPPLPQINLDIPSTPIAATLVEVDTPIASRSPVPLPASLSSLSSAIPTSLSTNGSTAEPPAAPSADVASLAPSDTASSILPPSPSAGYQPLADESDAEVASIASSVHESAQAKHAPAQGEHVEHEDARSAALIDL